MRGGGWRAGDLVRGAGRQRRRHGYEYPEVVSYHFLMPQGLCASRRLFGSHRPVDHIQLK